MKHLSLACTLALLTSCALPSIDVTPRYGQLNVEGDIGASTSGTALFQNDVDQIGIEDEKGYPGLRLDLDVGAPHIIFTGQNTVHDGDGVLSQDITIDGTTITAGTAVDTDFDLGIYSALVLFDLVPTEIVDVGLGFGITLVDLDLEVADTMSANTVESDETLPIPVLAAQVSTEITERFELAGLISGFAINIDDADVTYLDADIFARWAVFGGDERGRGSLVLGYRWTNLDVEYDDDSDVVEADLTFSGPYLGFQLSF